MAAPATDGSEPPGEHSPVTREAGLDHYRRGAYAEAARVFASLLGGTPEDATLLRLHGLALVRQGKPRDALPHLLRARRLAFADPLTHLHCGIGMQAAGCFPRAAALFRRAAMMMPGASAPWINFAQALIALGKPQAARAAARRALALVPDDADAHYTLGLAENAAGNAAGARAAFLAATRARPLFTDAWVNLGLACYRMGRVGEAIETLEAALRHSPDNAAAEANLAAFLLLRGEAETVLPRLRALVARAPDCVAARLNLANVLLHEDGPAEALSNLAGAPPEGREGAHWRAHRALALIQLGRTREAEAELDLIGDPHDAEILILWRRIHLALGKGEEAAAEAVAARMAALADDEHAAFLEHRVIGHFDLARFHDARGREAAAFEHWRRGHRLLNRAQPFSREAHAAFVSASVSAYGCDRLASGPRATNADQAPVFIVGMPRTGTTLMEQILSAHPGVFGAGERPAIQRLMQRLAGTADEAAMMTRLARLEGERLDREASTFLAELHALAPEALRIVDKMPGNARYLGFIATLLPGARIIHCRRDPRDIGFSIFRLRFFGYHPYAHDLADLGWAIGQHETLMEHWRRVLPAPILEVALEDWVSDFRATLARVLDFLGLPYDARCEQFHHLERTVRTASAAQVRQPINARGIGRWKRYEKDLAPMIAELERAGLIRSCQRS